MSPVLAILSGFFFCIRRHESVSMRLGPALLGSHTHDIHTTGTRDYYTRYPEYETTTHRRHNTSHTTQQDHNILIEFYLTTPLHVFSDLHFAYFTVLGSLSVGCGHGLRKVFYFFVFWFTVDPESQRLRGPHRTCPLAPTDWSLHMTAAFSECFGTPTSAVSTIFLIFLISVWFSAGSPYRVLHREIDGTVWAPTIKNTVMVMLYPPYTPLSLITTSLRATEDQTNVSPRLSLLEPLFSLCPSTGRLLLIDGCRLVTTGVAISCFS